MGENKEEKKIKEGRYIIIIPLLITVLCGWLDIWTNYAAGEYASKDCMEVFTNIIRCCMGYLFPSLLSIVVAMVWQQSTMNDSPYGVEPGKTGVAVIFTVIYSTIFITCLIKYNVVTAILIVVITIIYIVWFYNCCLDGHLKFKNKNDMNQEELLQTYLFKSRGKRNEKKR